MMDALVAALAPAFTWPAGITLLLPAVVRDILQARPHVTEDKAQGLAAICARMRDGCAQEMVSAVVEPWLHVASPHLGTVLVMLQALQRNALLSWRAIGALAELHESRALLDGPALALVLDMLGTAAQTCPPHSPGHAVLKDTAAAWSVCLLWLALCISSICLTQPPVRSTDWTTRLHVRPVSIVSHDELPGREQGVQACIDYLCAARAGHLQPCDTAERWDWVVALAVLLPQSTHVECERMVHALAGDDLANVHAMLFESLVVAASLTALRSVVHASMVCVARRVSCVNARR